MIRKLAFAVLALAAALALQPAPAKAAFGQYLCQARPVAAAAGPARVVNPNTSTAYVLNSNGCAFLAQADVGWAQSQGFVPGPNLFTVAATAITASTAASNSPVIPAGAYIHNIVIQETAGNAITGGVDIGSAAAGTQIVSAVTVGASALVAIADSALVKRVFSTTAPTTVFITCHTSCNSGSLNVSILYSLF